MVMHVLFWLTEGKLKGMRSDNEHPSCLSQLCRHTGHDVPTRQEEVTTKQRLLQPFSRKQTIDVWTQNLEFRKENVGAWV